MILAQFDWWPLDFEISGEYAWPFQELVKGRDGALDVYNINIPDQHAGWQFNSDAYDGNDLMPGHQLMDSNQTTIITSEELMVEPFFEHFIGEGLGEAGRFAGIYDGELLLATNNDTVASTQAGREETQFKLLAEAIPALTFAAAANEVDSFEFRNNFHMQDLRSSSWPNARTGNSTYNTRWLHSDLKDIAYPYISGVYDEVVRQGGLK